MTSTGMLPLADAELYFEVRGAGPTLVIAQSGEGDANRTEALVQRLEPDFTVVTYDRRGLSRSVNHASRVSIATHADDVARLLEHVTDGPATMLGCSIGATIGLHLAAVAPSRLTTLIAHEPISPWLLPAPARAQQQEEIDEILRIYRDHGWRAALPPMMRALGIDPTGQEREPGVDLPPLTPARAANLDHLLSCDMPAARDADLDVEALRRTPVQIVPAVGTSTPVQVFDYQCAVQLGTALSVPVQQLPGGHNGSITHPHGYGEEVRRLLNGDAHQS